MTALPKLFRLPVSLAACLCVVGGSTAVAQIQFARQVAEINFEGDANPRELTPVGSTLFFVADSTIHGPSSLWKSDGTFEGTAHVFAPFATEIHGLRAWNGALYFAANSFAAGVELWRSDGTEQGTLMVEDLRLGGESSDPQHLTASGKYLYFTADTDFRGRELWRTDGTPFGAQLVADVNFTAGSDPHDLVDFGGILLFIANDGVHGEELWRTDGTPQGTYMLKDIRPGPEGGSISEITVVGELAYFAADDGANGVELWRTDGTDHPFFATLPAFPEIRPGPASSSPSELTNLKGELVLVADDGIHGRELWKMDLDRHELTLVADIPPGPDSSNPSQLRAVEGRLYFTANEGFNGVELWASDGIPFAFNGTRLVEDIVLGPESSSPQHLTKINGTLFFQTNPEFADPEVWTVAMGSFGFEVTSTLLGIPPEDPSLPANFTLAGDRLFFVARDPFRGVELFTFDNQYPVASAGPDQTVAPGTVAEMNPFGSSDPDSSSFGWAFQWRDANGSTLAYDFGIGVPVPEPGVREVTFIMHDGLGGRGEDTVILSTPGRTAPVVTITSPAAGELLHAGTPADVMWTATDESAIVSVSAAVSTDGGLTYTPIPECALPGSATACTWTPPTVLEKGRLRVEACDEMGDCGRQTVAIEVRGMLTGPQRLDITVTGVDGTLGGVIGQGQDCFADVGQTEKTCTFFYDPGTEVTFQPLFTPPTAFLGWSGRCSGTGNCTVTMNGPRQVTAAFRPAQNFDFTVTVDSVDNGEGNVFVFGSDGSFQLCAALPGSTQTCTFQYVEGTVLDLQQSTGPFPGSTFVGWAGDCTGDGPCAVTMDQPRQVAATFRGPLGVTVTVASLGFGYGDVLLSGSDGSLNICSAVVGDTHTCTFPYAPGTQVQLEAMWGADDSSFLGWAGDCTGDGPCAVIVEQQRQVAATFQGLSVVNLYLNLFSSQLGLGRIDVVVSDGSTHTCQGVQGGSVDCVFPIARNTFVSLRPIPAPDSVFFWNGGCLDANNGPVTTGVCEFTMDGPHGYQGIFRGPQTLTLNVNSVENGSGRVQTNFEGAACENTPGTTAQCVFPIPFGRVVTLTAQPKPGSIFLGWSSGGCSGTGACTVTMSVTRTVNAAFKRVNAPPVAHAGGPYVGVRNQAITFNGSGSSDPDGNPLTYTWDFGDGTGGSGVAPSHAYSTLGTFTVTLTVSDGIVTSAPATTSATINNAAPVANAGGPYSGVRNQAIAFNGSGSSDPDGDALTYAWDFGDGTTGTGVTPTHAYSSLGVFTVRLAVSDGSATSVPAVTTVTINNVAPVANPGGPYAGLRNQPIQFNGSGSSDPDGDPLTYTWDFGDGTQGSGVAPTHAYATLDTFTVRLTVNDGHVTSAPAATTVTITNATPVANAGPDRTVKRHTVVLLDGRASSDPDGTIAAYAWRQVAGPPVFLLGDCFPVAAFTAPNVHDPVVLEFELNVTDSDGAVATDRVRITVTK